MVTMIHSSDFTHVPNAWIDHPTTQMKRFYQTKEKWWMTIFTWGQNPFLSHVMQFLLKHFTVWVLSLSKCFRWTCVFQSGDALNSHKGKWVVLLCLWEVTFKQWCIYIVTAKECCCRNTISQIKLIAKWAKQLPSMSRLHKNAMYMVCYFKDS